MSINKLFFKYKNKLLLESLLRAFIVSAFFMGLSAFIVSLVYHIRIQKPEIMLMLWICAGVGALAFLTTFLIRFPTKKRVAVRMDEMGLNERVCTMLENQKNEEKIAELQRNDAIVHIKNSSVKNMKLRVSRKEIISCCACICLAFVMIMLPHDIFAFANPEIQMDEEQQQLIKDLIEDLREEIKKSELDEETKDKANEIIDRLETELNKTDSKLEQAGKVEEAKKELSELLDKLLTKNSIGKELMKYELTRPLGQGVLNADEQKVTQALDELENKIKAERELKSDLSEIILKALKDSGVAATDGLYIAFDVLANDLSALDVLSQDFEKELKEIFEKAEAAINEQLKKQAAIEKEKQEISDKMEDAKDELLGKEEETATPPTGGGSDPGKGGDESEGNKPGDKPGEDGKPGGDKPGGDKPGGDKPGGDGGEGKDDTQQGGSSGDNGEKEDTMTEGIFDPVSGSTTYGKVFATYYSEYLKAVKNGEVSEELKEIIDRYFSSLTNTKE